LSSALQARSDAEEIEMRGIVAAATLAVASLSTPVLATPVLAMPTPAANPALERSRSAAPPMTQEAHWRGRDRHRHWM
jgi:hypothetical protein